MTVQVQIVELLRRLQAKHGLAYVFVSHDLRVVRALAHQVVVMQNGDVVESGDSASLFAAPRTEYTRTLLAAAFDLEPAPVERFRRDPAALRALTTTGRPRDAHDHRPRARPLARPPEPPRRPTPRPARTIRLFDPGWTDINSTNAVATTILEALGYEPERQHPLGRRRLRGDEGRRHRRLPRQLDAGAHEFRADLDAAKAVEVLTQNLAGAKFTLAVPSYVGIADFAELDPNAERFGSKIYGIDPGTAGNNIIQAMIENDDFGLGDWELVETSEQAMLAQVDPRREVRGRDRLPRLGAAPDERRPRHHLPRRRRRAVRPDYGGADVFTLARTGWAAECPNAAQFFRNLDLHRSTSRTRSWR